MTTPSTPLVSILTPVYNGEQFLEECIESVINQTYKNFVYTIVNNKSADRSLDIALSYAKRDARVTVVSNDRFAEVIENHNIAFRLTSPNARYCKIVSADDAIFPDCLERMVATAEANPSAGVIGCYQLSGTRVRWQGYPFPKTLINGRDLGRQMLMMRDALFGFGSPTSLLYRADLVRRTSTFFPNHSPHADTSACYECMKDSDFAFVYQVLCLERLSGNTQSSRAARIREDLPASVSDVINYGRYFLAPDEYERKTKELLQLYYEALATQVVAGKGRSFLAYHKRRLGELGVPMKPSALIKAGMTKFIREISNPGHLIAKARRSFARPSP